MWFDEQLEIVFKLVSIIIKPSWFILSKWDRIKHPLIQFINNERHLFGTYKARSKSMFVNCINIFLQFNWDLFPNDDSLVIIVHNHKILSIGNKKKFMPKWKSTLEHFPLEKPRKDMMITDAPRILRTE